MKLVLMMCCLLFCLAGSGQDSCALRSFRTITVGNGKQFFSLEAKFVVSRDSIVLSGNGSYPGVHVFLIKKSSCHWNKDFTEGESIYEAVLADNDRKAKIQIIVNDVKKIVQIDYEGSDESRIFTMPD